jgi:hypothetical protein
MLYKILTALDKAAQRAGYDPADLFKIDYLIYMNEADAYELYCELGITSSGFEEYLQGTRMRLDPDVRAGTIEVEFISVK